METIILFDLDGTVIDSTDAIVSTFHYSFEKIGDGKKVTDDAIKALIGYPLDIMYAKLGVEKERVWDYVDIYKERYKTISIAQTTLLENAKESIQLARSFARLGIVTTKTTAYTIPLLENMEIFHYFETIVGRQEVTNPKPHPEPILKAMELMNINSLDYNIYMIGDTKLDLIAARDANIKGIGVLCGYGAKSELMCYTNAIFNDTFEAVKEIKKLTK